MTDELRDDIRKRAVEWAKKITRLANQYLGDKNKIISVKSVREEQGDKIGTKTTAKGAAARAYEYGSGVHSRISRKSPKQLGVKGKILIKPNGHKFLAFNWEVANKNPEQFMFHEDGRVLLPAVKHPGVKAVNNNKGYIAPAINEVNKDIRKQLPVDVRKAVVGTLRRSFKK